MAYRQMRQESRAYHWGDPGGLGGGFILVIAHAQASLLILAGRSIAKLQQTADAVSSQFPSVEVHILELDLASLSAVRAAADDSTGGPTFRGSTSSTTPASWLNGHPVTPFRFDNWKSKNGERYNKWIAYDRSKTAGIPTAISLASKPGAKRNILAFSVQPGLVISGLGSHLELLGDDASDMESMREIDRPLENSLAWVDFATRFKVQIAEEAVANLVYAAFDSGF
ncbi:hypothetical protein AAE478_010382 [Parahypoxylon ruwenzoriense]